MTTAAVVTGAASGIGRACVDVVRDLVDVVFATDLSAPAIEGTQGRACDVTDRAALADLARAVSGVGDFRALVHAAGVSPSMGDARLVFEVDLVGTHQVLAAFEPLVRPGSSAVCISSSAAYQIAPAVDAETDFLLDAVSEPDFLDRACAAVPDSGFAYALAKRGVIRCCARAAVPWGRRGGRVNSVAPGLIDTPMGQLEFEHQPIKQDMLAKTPLERVGDPGEIAAAVGFLLSAAASFVSGVDLLVDGGMLQGLINQ